MANPNHYPSGSEKGGQFAPKNLGYENYDISKALPKKKSKTRKRLEKLTFICTSKKDGDIEIDVGSLYHVYHSKHNSMVNKKSMEMVKDILENPEKITQSSDNKNYRCYYQTTNKFGRKAKYVRVVIDIKKKRMVTTYPCKKIGKDEETVYEK